MSSCSLTPCGTGTQQETNDRFENSLRQGFLQGSAGPACFCMRLMSQSAMYYYLYLLNVLGKLVISCCPMLAPGDPKSRAHQGHPVQQRDP